jgi:hypothetical protein
MRGEVGGISRKRLIFALCVSISYSYIVVVAKAKETYES